MLKQLPATTGNDTQKEVRVKLWLKNQNDELKDLRKAEGDLKSLPIVICGFITPGDLFHIHAVVIAC